MYDILIFIDLISWKTSYFFGQFYKETTTVWRLTWRSLTLLECTMATQVTIRRRSDPPDILDDSGRNRWPIRIFIAPQHFLVVSSSVRRLSQSGTVLHVRFKDFPLTFFIDISMSYTSCGVNRSSLLKWVLLQNSLEITKTTFFSLKLFLVISAFTF